jgi:hypothetical protein
MTKNTSENYPGYELYTYYWIAFNVFYNLNYFFQNPDQTIWTSKEYKRILNVFTRLDAEKCKIIVERSLAESPDYLTLLSHYTVFGKNNVDLVTSLKDACSRDDYKKTLENLIMCLYAIRSNLFHGIKEPDDTRQNKRLLESASVLKMILTILLEPYFLDK